MPSSQALRGRLKIALVAAILAAAALSYCQQCARTADAAGGGGIGEQNCQAVSPAS